MAAEPEVVQSQAAAAIGPVKRLSESLTSIPPDYIFFTDPVATGAEDAGDSIPVIDISALTSGDSQRRSKALEDLDRACQDWGFFMLVDHGIPEGLIEAVIDVSDEFFNLPEEDKPEFQPRNVLEPIRYGTSFNTSKEKIFCWRDFLKLFVHPQFHSPNKPSSIGETVHEYCQRTRELVGELMKGISQSLGLQPNEMQEALNLESSLQIFVANYYPRCCDPVAALGMVPHSDHGLLTFLITNGVGGLQIQHAGEWVNVAARRGAILVNAGDHLEIFSNGKYSSVLHRVVVNDQSPRISVAVANGPSLETIVRPPEKLFEGGGGAPLYAPMKYSEYLMLQQSNSLNEKSSLQHVKIPQ